MGLKRSRFNCWWRSI